MRPPPFEGKHHSQSFTGAPPSAVSLIESERRRQISVEGWTPEHDDEHTDGELAAAAACYAVTLNNMETRYEHRDVSCGRGECPVWENVKVEVPVGWPEAWDTEWWKPKDRVRNLVRSGALYLAEQDRLQRAGLPFDHITAALEAVIVELDHSLGAQTEVG